jgi:hypothetical protein
MSIEWKSSIHRQKYAMVKGEYPQKGNYNKSYDNTEVWSTEYDIIFGKEMNVLRGYRHQENRKFTTALWINKQQKLSKVSMEHNFETLARYLYKLKMSNGDATIE